MSGPTTTASAPPVLRGLAAGHRRLAELLAHPRRSHRPVILGIVGPPGSGKTTLAEHLLEHLGEHASLLSMDGFHLSNSELVRLGRRDRKGAPDTFDTAGYAHALGRVRSGESLFAPVYDRHLSAPIAAGTWIDADRPLVLTEGNYLLLDDVAWAGVAPHLDEVWYVGGDDARRRERLVARHMRFGTPEAHARAWVESVDEPNARLVAATRTRADWIIEVDSLP